MSKIKRKKGFLVFPKGYKIDHPLASTYYSKYRIRDNPEVVCRLADDIPEIREHLDLKFYKNWKKGLSYVPKIKKRNDFSFNDYNFGPFPPYPHQRKMLMFCRVLPRAGLFAETGTGKTYVGAHIIQMRIKKGLIGNALIVAPKAVVEDGWPEELEKFTDLDFTIAHNTLSNKKGDISELVHKSEVTITTPGTFKNHIKKFKNRGFDQCIIDESDMIGTSSKRAKALRSMQDWVDYRLIMTGTPGSLEKLYHQGFFVGARLEHSLTKFRNRWCFSPPGHHYINNPIKGSRKKVAKKCSNFCLKISKEVLNLPDQKEETVVVKPSEKIKKHYAELVKDFYTRIDDEDLITKTNLEQIIKLHQTIQGHVKIDGETKIIEPTPPKIDVARNLSQKHSGDTIIWAKYKQDFENLKKEFGQDVPTVNGDTYSVKKELDRFRSDKHDVLLAHPMSIRYGITLNNANTMIYYSYGWSIISKIQTSARNHRIGQEDETYIYSLNSGGVENKILKSLQQKEEFNDIMLDAIKEKSVGIEDDF